MTIFEKTLEEIRKYYGVAGCAFIAIKNGKVIVKDCLGYADVDAKRPITENSFFDIASCSKAFTTCMVAQLCDEGKMDWDTPVINYYPDFKMYDKYANEHITPRDMASHRSGLSRHDLVRRGVLTDRKDYVSRIAHYVPSKGFREKMQYQNQIYAALGYIAEQVDGKIWEDMIIERIAKPLDMEVGFRGISDLKGLDAALPYDQKNGKLELTAYNNCSANNPCGGVKTNLKSIEHWITMLANNGVFNGNEILSKEQMKQIKTPVIYMGEVPMNPNDKQRCYSLGWMPSIYKGKRLIAHGGSIQGFNASVGFLPDENAAFACLVNTNGTPTHEIFKYILCDSILNELEDDYGYMAESYHNRVRPEEEKIEALEKLPLTQEELNLYAGDYYNDGYHNLKIEKNQNGGLTIKYADVYANIYKNSQNIFQGYFNHGEIFADVRFAKDGKSAIMSFSEAYSPTLFNKI